MSNKFRNVVRQVDCPDCGAVSNNRCNSKANDGTTIKGVHRGRQLVAYSYALIIQNNNPFDKFDFQLP